VIPSSAMTPQRPRVHGYPLDPLTLDEAAAWVLAAARGSEPRRIVTLNPEILVRARSDAALHDALLRADLSVADGIGIVWAARRARIALPGRVAGIDLAYEVLARGGDLRVYLLGGRPGVAERAAAAARGWWGTNVVGHHHGYFGADEQGRIASAIAASGAQLVLAGLGEGQEIFLERYRHELGAGASIGVGGTLDVMAGVVRRAPAWSRRWGLEWALRIGLDPGRWHRLPHLARFALLTLRSPRGG
jgi:N-acetylglucosaminyldiphosphoundecaprenol N-acetyl-beta-D-mannosaminyltransferase